jgi:putative holliday junction resolvase
MSGTLLGFDYGLRRIGVAVGQTVTGTANPLTTLRARNGVPDWDAVRALVEEWRPVAAVVGVPRHADGSDNALTPRATRFARQLEGRFGLSVHQVDERLSSHAAGQALEREGRRHTAEDIDSMAAARILEDWLGTQ